MSQHTTEPLGGRSLLSPLSARWRERGGYRQLLVTAFPLILSTGSTSIYQFVDRMFLTWYSPTSVAAAMPAGMMNFTLMSVFIAAAGYVNTFVAQYHGAFRPQRIGPSLWQGIYVSIFGAVVLFVISLFSSPIFRLVGHSESIQVQEVIYFRILCQGAFFPIVSSALAGFFSGRSRNWPIMWASVISTLVNLGLDYLLIFGSFGFPELGIAGAAIATVIAGACAVVYYLICIFVPKSNRRYQVRQGWKFDKELLLRVLRYGVPSGVQFFVDVAGFSFFILMVGRIGTIELAATSIAFNINTLAFMPMIGFGVAISVVVGQFQGENSPQKAQRSVFSGAHICFLYMATVALTYVALPGVYLAPFAVRLDPSTLAQIRPLEVMMLRFIAFYTLFDTLNIVFSSALKGAGDTRFVMIVIALISIGVLIIPSYVVLGVFHGGITIAWALVSTYISTLGLAFLLRFLTGRWKSMKVIEHAEHGLPGRIPEVPSADLEL